jgi:hypothetical protein
MLFLTLGTKLCCHVLLLNWNLGCPAEEARNIGSLISLSGYFGHRKQDWGSLLKVSREE